MLFDRLVSFRPTFTLDVAIRFMFFLRVSRRLLAEQANNNNNNDGEPKHATRSHTRNKLR